MPQLPTMNSNGQRIPRIFVPEAIIDGKAEGYPCRKIDRASIRVFRLSDARPRAGAHALQIWRLDFFDDEQH
jgi:hypothetical protein